MIIQNLNSSHPKREPLPRTWFLSRGYKKADPAYTNGCTIWLHPVTNDVLSPYGQNISLRVVPCEKYRKFRTGYLKLTGRYGDMLLARLKYITFIGPIPEGYTIDHINGNKSDDEHYNELLRDLRTYQKVLAKQIEKKVYLYGFLKGEVTYSQEELTAKLLETERENAAPRHQLQAAQTTKEVKIIGGNVTFNDYSTNYNVKK